MRSCWIQDGIHAASLKSLHTCGMKIAIRPHNNLVNTAGVASGPARTVPPWGIVQTTWPLMGPEKLILKEKNEGVAK